LHVFLSHNRHDQATAVKLAAQLRLIGVDVWLDAWEIRPGDSIPGKVSQALAAVDTVIVLWSTHAAGSPWVEAELATAINRRMAEGLRVIPVLLDETDLPALLRPLKWLRLDDHDGPLEIASRIADLDSQAAVLKAIQHTIDEAGLEVAYYPGYGFLVGCPRCGAPPKDIEGWQALDERRDDMYAGARCKQCRWEDGGEL
jgi:hypothetical protein